MSEQELQPTVRVMRLYKPGQGVMSLVASGLSDLTACAMDSGISGSLRLPESFGDVYLGEMFHAYIAVVNDHEVSFPRVQMQVRVQTSTAVHDLVDACVKGDGGQQTEGALLRSHEKLDMVVQHRLVEEGTYTMRVTILYGEQGGTLPVPPGSPVPTPPPTETGTKTLRKFYRFNVTSPLTAHFSSTLYADRALVHGTVCNATKKFLYLEQFSLELTPDLAQQGVSAEDLTAVFAMHVALVQPDGALNPDALQSAPILQPGESYGVCLTVRPPVTGRGAHPLHPGTPLGNIVVRWHSQMGENAYFTSEPITLGSADNGDEEVARVNEHIVAVACAKAPLRVCSGEIFEITLAVSHLGQVGESPVNVELSTRRAAEKANCLRIVNARNVTLTDVKPGDPPRQVQFTVCALDGGLKVLDSLEVTVGETKFQTGCLVKVLSL